MSERDSPSYSISKPATGWRSVKSFTVEERRRLWPIAETLAMLDGNAFFVFSGKYQWGLVAQYLPEASALYEANGGDKGWAGEALLKTKFADHTQDTSDGA